MSELLDRLLQQQGILKVAIGRVNDKIQGEKLRIALKEMAQNKELMKALKINTGGK